MRVLICGSRTWRDRQAIGLAVCGLPRDAVVIHGGADGADALAGQAAVLWRLQQEVYPADWAKHGKAAGPIRNQQMLDEGHPDRVIAFRMPGASRGTDDMIRRAKRAGIPVEVVTP